MANSRAFPWRAPAHGHTLDATAFARVAVFAGIIAVLGLPGGFTILGSVPITAQTLGVMLAGAILGPWSGALSVTVLLGLVGVGMPLLAGGRGGPGVFFGPSAGYLRRLDSIHLAEEVHQQAYLRCHGAGRHLRHGTSDPLRRV